MKRIYTFFVSLILCITAIAQNAKPTITFFSIDEDAEMGEEILNTVNLEYTNSANFEWNVVPETPPVVYTCGINIYKYDAKNDKTPLAEPITVTENGQERKLRTIGDRWSYLQRYKFGANAQPFYVLLDPNGKPLAPSYSFNEDVAAYIEWLNSGLK